MCTTLQIFSPPFDVVQAYDLNQVIIPVVFFSVFDNPGSDVSGNAYVVGKMGAATREVAARQHHLCRHECFFAYVKLI